MTYIPTQNDRRVPREKKGQEAYRLTTNRIIKSDVHLDT